MIFCLPEFKTQTFKDSMDAGSQPKMFFVGELVWAKLKNRLPWPGKIVDPTKPEFLKHKPTTDAELYLVYFFQTNDFAWMEAGAIKSFQKFKHQLSKLTDDDKFVKACKQIEEEAAKQENEIHEGKNEDLLETSSFNKSVSTNANIEPKTSNSSSPSKPLEPTEFQTSANCVQDFATHEIIEDSSASPEPENCTASKKLDLLNSSSPLGNLPLLEEENIVVSEVYGFVGVGYMGSSMIKNLLHAGYRVVIWNRTIESCMDLKAKGAEVVDSPSDVVVKSRITFACLSDQEAAKEVFYGATGIVAGIKNGSAKSFVNMTSINPETSRAFYEDMKSMNGEYLEAQVFGTRNDASLGNLMIFCSGDQSLYKSCLPLIRLLGSATYYLKNDPEDAIKMRLVLQVINGAVLTGLSEGIALANATGLNKELLKDVITGSPLASRFVLEKTDKIIKDDHQCQESLQNLKMGVMQAMHLAHEMDFPMCTTAITLECLKHAKKRGHGDQDCSIIYKQSKF